MVLEPALPTQDIVYGIVKFKPVPVEIKNRTTIPAVHVRTGTEPAGTMWIRNPIPACYGQLGGGEMSACDGPQFPPPIPGLFGFGPARCGAPALFQALYSKRVGTLRCNWNGQSLTVQHTLTPRHLKPCSRHHPQQLQPHPGAGQLREVLQLLARGVPALGRNKARESPAAFVLFWSSAVTHVLCLLVFCRYSWRCLLVFRTSSISTSSTRYRCPTGPEITSSRGEFGRMGTAAAACAGPPFPFVGAAV